MSERTAVALHYLGETLEDLFSDEDGNKMLDCSHSLSQIVDQFDIATTELYLIRVALEKMAGMEITK